MYGRWLGLEVLPTLVFVSPRPAVDPTVGSSTFRLWRPRSKELLSGHGNVFIRARVHPSFSRVSESIEWRLTSVQITHGCTPDTRCSH